MPSKARPTQPIEILKWEHERLLSGIGEIQALNDHSSNGHFNKIAGKVNSILLFLELHQEAEERFLFPLVPELGDTPFSGLREEHLLLLNGSDVLVSIFNSKKPDWLRHYLRTLGSTLEEHFLNEETNVYQQAEKILTPAQVDILKIKFATRRLT